MDDVNNTIRNGIRDYAYENGLSFYDQREHTGLLRGMMIRLSNTGELMLLMQFCIMDDKEQQQADAMLQWISDNYKQISSLLWVNNQKFNDTFGDLRAAGVVDPAKVTRVALENAASVAGMFLTTVCVICDKKEDQPEMPMGAPGMGGMM